MLDRTILSAAWLTLGRLAEHDPRVSAVIIATVEDCLREGYRVRAWCWRCERTAEIDLEALVSRGLGSVPFSHVRRAFRCTSCHGPGQIIRTPADAAYQ